MKKLLSLVIPVYNEADGLNRFHYTMLLPQLELLNLHWEIIYVNDGSSDKSQLQLSEMATQDRRVKVVSLSRNFGKEIAVTAGIFYAHGDALVVMDADGQHPPHYLHEFVDKWIGGGQVVVGIRISNQKEGLVKKWGSKLFYKLFNSTSGFQLVPGSTDFRLLDKSVQSEFIKFQERNRITRGLIDWMGFSRDYVYFHSPARLAGQASYSTRQLLALAMNSFVSLSLKPLFFLMTLGLFVTFAALFFGVFMFIEQFLMGDPLSLNFTGAALLGIFISFLVGIVLMSQGILAVYLSHVHTQALSRPLFIVDVSKSSNLELKLAAESIRQV